MYIFIFTGLMVIDNINAIAEAMGQHPSAFFVTLCIDVYVYMNIHM
jgi:hypothetical protein